MSYPNLLVVSNKMIQIIKDNIDYEEITSSTKLKEDNLYKIMLRSFESIVNDINNNRSIAPMDVESIISNYINSHVNMSIDDFISYVKEQLENEYEYHDTALDHNANYFKFSTRQEAELKKSYAQYEEGIQLILETILFNYIAEGYNVDKMIELYETTFNDDEMQDCIEDIADTGIGDIIEIVHKHRHFIVRLLLNVLRKIPNDIGDKNKTYRNIREALNDFDFNADYMTQAMKLYESYNNDDGTFECERLFEFKGKKYNIIECLMLLEIKCIVE